MIEFILYDDKNYSDLFSYVFGGVLALVGIVASILLFLVDRKINQASNILDNLIIKIANKELNYKEIKFWIKIYTDQWNRIRFNKFLRVLLYLFFISSIVLIYMSLILLNDRIPFSLYALIAPIFIFSLIIYEILEAPNTWAFKQWRPHELIKHDGSYREISEDNFSFLDIDNIKRLEHDPFRSEKHFIRINIDNIHLYLDRKLNGVIEFLKKLY